MKRINILLNILLSSYFLFNCSPIKNHEDIELIFNNGPRFILSSTVNVSGTRLALRNYTGEVQLWNLKTYQLIRTYKHLIPSHASIAFTKDQHHLLIPLKKKLILLNLLTGHAEQLGSPFSPIVSLAYHYDSNTIACGLENGYIQLWRNFKKREQLKGTSPVNDIKFLSKHHLIAATAKGTIEFWNLTTQTTIKRIQTHSGPITHIALSPNKKQLLSISNNNEFKLWDLKSKSLVYSSQKHKAPVKVIAFTPDNNYFVTVDKMTAMYFGDRKNFSVTKSIKGKNDLVLLNQIHFIPDSETMLLAGNGLFFWDWSKLEKVHEMLSQTRFVEGVTLDKKAQYLVLGGDDNFIRLFNLRTGQQEKRLKHDHLVFATRLDKSNTHLISASQDKTIKIWDFPSGQLKATLKGHQDRVCCIALTPDQKWLVSASKDTTLKIWSYPEGKVLKTMTGHTNRITSLSMSPDGKMVATGSLDKTARVWDVSTGKGLKIFDVQARVNGSSFDQSNKHLYTASTNKGLQIWDIKTGQLLDKPITENVQYVDVKNDHYYVALGSGEIQKRSLKDHHVLRTYIGQQHRVHDLLIRPDVNRLISAGYDDKALIWNLHTGELLMTIQPLLKGGWLAYTPDSRFDASPDVFPYLYWRSGMNLFPLETFKEKKYQPGLLKEMIRDN